PVEANAELIGTMSAWDSSTPLGDDEVAIPLYKEVELAAGGGATEVIEVPGRLLRFAKSTLREAGVMPTNAVCATIKGHSMERLIMDGATIGIDTGSKHIEDGEIYAFDQDGMLRVKYLYRLPGGGVRVRSENDDEFPDETLSPEQFASIRMLGWVFWWSTVRRRRGLSIAK
ncbi:MAG: helix-turn-helix transcriptional regulator, partial [Burkholderiaceae bacterium]|nr:helix-turn-helix transcriptional regulator [Burkholderiaceae bacterium]